MRRIERASVPPDLKDPHSALLGEADQGTQAFDQERALIVGHIALAGGIHERLQFLPARASLPDFAGPHGDLRCLTGTGGALVNDLAS